MRISDLRVCAQLVVIVISSCLLAASCAASDDTPTASTHADPDLESTQPTASDPSKSSEEGPVAPTAETTIAQSLGYTEAVGFLPDLASQLAGAFESEYYSSVSEAAVAADAVIVGHVAGVARGRTVVTGGSVPDLPFAEMTVVEVDTGLRYVVEFPFAPTSPELEAAVEAAIDREAVDKATTDDELAAAIDREAIDKAYSQHYDTAIDYTIDQMHARVPMGRGVFFLRAQPDDIPNVRPEAFRLINGSGLLIEFADGMTVPLRDGHGDHDEMTKEVEGLSFDDVARAALETGR